MINNLQKENLGSVAGVVIFVIASFFLFKNDRYISILIVFVVYILATQWQLSEYKVKSKKNKALSDKGGSK